MNKSNAGKSPHAARHMASIDTVAEMCAQAVQFANLNADAKIKANNAELARMFEQRIKAERPLARLRAWWTATLSGWRRAPMAFTSSGSLADEVPILALSQNEVAP